MEIRAIIQQPSNLTSLPRGLHRIPCTAPAVAYAAAMNVKVVVHEAAEGGFWAEVPSLPGCASQGETMEELIANLREAIAGWLGADSAPREMGDGDRILELAL